MIGQPPVHILLVEDNPTDALLARESLSSRDEFAVQTATHLADAVKLLQHDTFDVILLDLGLPDSQGLATLEKMRAVSHCPIVVLTGNDNEEVGIQALHFGAQDYLVKRDVVGMEVGRAVLFALERNRLTKALRESEERHRRLLEVMPDAVFVNTDNRISYCNPACARLLGAASPADVVGRPPLTIFHAKYHDLIRRRIEELRQHGGVLSPIEEEVVTEDGAIVPVEVVAAVSSFQGTQSILVMLHDLRKRRDAEERLRRMFDQSLTADFVCDPLGKIVICNPSFALAYGFETPQEAVDAGVQLFPDEQERRELFAALALSDRTHKHERWITRRDGRRRLVIENLVGIFNPAGELTEVQGYQSDITDRREAEAALLLQDRAIQAVSQGILITDPNLPDCPIIYASSGFERMTGYSAGESMGRNCRFLQGKDTDRETVGRLREAIAAGRECSVEVLNYKKDGSPFWNALTLTPVRNNSGGKPTYYVGVQVDITDRKRLEDQLRQAQKMEAVGRLAGGVAHDFNNILTVIEGYSEIVLSLPDATPPIREHVTVIAEAGERAAGLTRQLLAFSRQSMLQPKVLDLNAVVAETGKLLCRLIGEDIQFATVLDPQLNRVKVDPGQLDQVLMNLAVNARDAMPKGGRLTIETANVELTSDYVSAHLDCKPGRHVMLAMTDTGCGMAPDTLSRVFEPFFTTKGVGKGTGLGLSTVFGIVQQSGGCIHVYSEPNRGSTFKIYLPAVTEQVTPQKDAAAGASLRGQETILLVEDEEGVRGLALASLKMQGYHVLPAVDGKHALAVAEQHGQPIDLLLTDVVMPNISGPELAERMQARYPGIKILFMSGYTDDTVVRHGILTAETAFVQKPYTPQNLARKVRQVLDGA